MTKALYATPAIPHYFVPRNALHKAMKKAIAIGQHLLLSAPGGYGKTATVAQFLADRQPKTTWLALTGADNEATMFSVRLAEALDALYPLGSSLPDTEKDAKHFTGRLEEILQLAKELPLQGSQRYLVLDDFHVLTNPDILRRLPLMLDALPHSVTVLLVGRTALSEGFEAIERGFTVFDASALAFSLREAEMLQQGYDPHISKELIHARWSMTGGWAIALWALLFEDTALDGKTRGTASLDEYLINGIWQQWDVATHDFLLCCAVPPALTEELALRLTERQDAGTALASLQKTGVLLNNTGDKMYRFHDLIRAFLLRQVAHLKSVNEVKALRATAAEWYFEQEDYYTATHLYIQNNDHEGITRCMRASTRLNGSMQNLSVEAKSSFVNSYVADLPDTFVEENAYLMSKCASVAFLDGKAEQFTHYVDLLFTALPSAAKDHPDLVQTAGFIGSLDFRISLDAYAQRLAVVLKDTPPLSLPQESREAASSTMTQNLPLLHRSMRDFSEYHSLDEGQMELLRSTFGVMIGPDYPVMEQCYIAGIHYEQNNLQKANYHALLAVRWLQDNTQAETTFCAHMILALVYDAMDASRFATTHYEHMDKFTNSTKASFLRTNFIAMQTARTLKTGNVSPAKRWLDYYAASPERLPFYQMTRHFTTLRAYMALEQYAEAVAFGMALQALCESYHRPTDTLECGIITSMALWRTGRQSEALRSLDKCVRIAQPLDFIQQFVNEGNNLLPLLWALDKRVQKNQVAAPFLQRIIDAAYATHSFTSEQDQLPHLSPQQKAMLTYLAAGLSYSQIAEKEGVKHGTVKTHVLKMYKALQVHNAEEAVARARMLGILQ